MTAPFDPSSFQTGAKSELAELATLWRGTMIGVYARAEFDIGTCLTDLAAAGIALPRDAQHDGAKARLAALIELLEREKFDHHERAAVRWLTRFSQLADERNMLAHGNMLVGQRWVEFSWRAYRKGAATRQTVRHTPLEMLVLVTQRQTLQRNVRAQLGQVVRSARALKLNP